MAGSAGAVRPWTRAVAALVATCLSFTGLSVPALAAEPAHGVTAWGANASGQIGDGTTTARRAGVATRDVADAVAVTAGDAHSVALQADGTVRAWGLNSNGQLGDNTITARKTPVGVAGLANVTAVAAGNLHNLALRADGSVWAWGRNASGQLGDSTVTARRAPVQVPGLTDVTAVAAGDQFSLAARADGSVVAWGANASGQLGDNTVTARRTPVPVAGLNGVTALAAGATHSLALRNDGTVWAWGANSYGQLGDNTVTARRTPVPVAGLTNVVAIATGDTHSLALLADGTIRTWGRNAYGQLGDNTITTRRAPVTVPGLSGVRAIAAGDAHSLAARTDGTVRAWGYNNAGQLGDGTVTTRRAPVLAGGVVNVAVLAGGTSHTLATGRSVAAAAGADPTGYWPAEFDGTDNAGTNPAVVGEGVDYAAGKVTCAWRFAGGQATVELPDAPALEPGARFTFATWVNAGDTAGTRFLAGKTGPGGTAWVLSAVDGKLSLRVTGGGQEATVTSATAALRAGDWRHVALTYDGALAHADRVRLFLDGANVALAPISGFVPVALADVVEPIRLGATPAPAVPALTGLLDEVRLFNRALSAGEVNQIVADDEAAAGTPCDQTAPTTGAAYSQEANVAGWHRSPVDVTLTATDNPGGSGVSGLTYSAAGAQELAETTVEDATATVNVAAEGETTLTAAAADTAGNAGAPASYPVRVDATVPTVTAERSPAPNADGWVNRPATVRFTCSDAVSGVADCPSPVTTDGEGADLAVEGTATDAAGNAASAAVTGIKVDRTAPALSGAASAPPNLAAPQASWGAGSLNGWHRGDVMIDWTATDTLSGVDPAAVPPRGEVTGEGRGLTATATVVDRAGNATTAASAPVDIDRTAPATTVSAPSGWQRDGVTVALAADDNLSGVASTSWSLDGGPAQAGDRVVVDEEGDHTLTVFSTDSAGNAEVPVTVEVHVDRTAPTIAHDARPAANTLGWNNAAVTVTFTCADGTSGVATCTAPVQVTQEGRGQVVPGVAVDGAGNTATDAAVVSIDRTAPAVAAAADRRPNAHGWYAAPVTVTFACDDALSGVEACAAPATVGEGRGQAATGVGTDAAGNSAEGTARGLSVDTSAPALRGATTTEPNVAGWHRGDVTVEWSCADSGAGVDGECPAATVIPGEGENLAAAASVADRAGNTTDAVVAGVRIDRTAPTTTTEIPAPGATGWYPGPVEVTLQGHDALSGVAATYYRVDGGDPVRYEGTFTHGMGGVHELAFYSVDRAGNVADATTLALALDNRAPRIAGERSPAANANGWNNTPVDVHFVCADDESGVAACGPDAQLTGEGAGQAVAGQATDAAGNTAGAGVQGVNIDLTAPELTGTPTTEPNAAGWYRGDVAVRWEPTDGLSGVDPATVPADEIVTGEGSDLGTRQVSVSDRAGNIGNGRLGGLRIDRTAPVVAAALTDALGTPISANTAGWYRTAVRVGFDCTDALSGVAACAGDTLLDGDGAAQAATGTGTDLAGNTASTAVPGINIDSQAPTTTATTSCFEIAGWCRGESGTVVLDAADTDGLSGVAALRYRVGDGPETVVEGARAVVEVPLTDSGSAVVRFAAVDHAGNAEAERAVTLAHDNVAPVVTPRLSLAANAAGWHDRAVTVGFDAVDDERGSGIDAASVTPDAEFSDETRGRTVAGSATDRVGNRGQAEVMMRLDRTAPTVTAAATTQPNADGWYREPVTVRYTCNDGLSGVASCPGDTVVTDNGTGLSVEGAASDVAGNGASATLDGVNVDSVAPEVGVVGMADGGVYRVDELRWPRCVASDAGSGLAGQCQVTLNWDWASVGTFTLTAKASDKAGNTTARKVTFKVIHRWGGWKAPMTAPGHGQADGTLTFKAGSTVPVKFAVNARDASAEWLAPVQGARIGEPTDAGASMVLAQPAAGAVRATGNGQYQYNWNTAKLAAGYYWHVGVRLNDGQVHWVTVALR